jgi:hypothetical protein
MDGIVSCLGRTAMHMQVFPGDSLPADYIQCLGLTCRRHRQQPWRSAAWTVLAALPYDLRMENEARLALLLTLNLQGAALVRRWCPARLWSSLADSTLDNSELSKVR